MIKGIQCVTDEKGNRTAILIDRQSPIWEDIQDSMLLVERLKEQPRESLASVRKRHEKRKISTRHV